MTGTSRRDRASYLFPLFCAALIAAASAGARAQDTAHRHSAHKAAKQARKHASVYLNSPVPPITITAQKQTMQPSSNKFSYDGDATLLAGDELMMHADHISADLGLSQLDASGDVSMQELSTSISASEVHFNGASKASSLVDATYRLYPYTVISHEMIGTADRLDMTNATITTSPPDAPRLLRMQAQNYTIDRKNKRMIGRNVSVWLGKVKLFTIRKIVTKIKSDQQNAQTQHRSQTVGYNSYEGAFVAAGNTFNIGQQAVGVSGLYSSAGKNSAAIGTGFEFKPIPLHLPQTTASSDTAVGSVSSAMTLIRESTRAGQIPVPEDDPLRFHDFTAPLPMTNLFGDAHRNLDSSIHFNAAYDQRVYGTPISYLYVSRWPELILSASAPIGPIRRDFPLGVDADETRRILRQPEFEFTLSDTGGFYREVPTEVASTRNEIVGSFDTRSFLLAPNLLCYGALSYIRNTYGNDAMELEYPQASVAVERLFTSLSGIGAQVTYASVKGATPFTFDSLGAAHEFDLRGQYGNGFLVLGTLAQWDLQRNRLYDIRYTLGPNFHGIMPRISYDNLTKSIGVSLDVIGITY